MQAVGVPLEVPRPIFSLAEIIDDFSIQGVESAPFEFSQSLFERLSFETVRWGENSGLPIVKEVSLWVRLFKKPCFSLNWAYETRWVTLASDLLVVESRLKEGAGTIMPI